MNFLKKVFGFQKSSMGSHIVSDSELALDGDQAWSLVKDGGPSACAVSLSADKHRVIFASKQSFVSDEIAGLKHAIEQGMVYLETEVLKAPTFPVFILKPKIFDRPDPQQAFWIETFPNIDGKDKEILEVMLTRRYSGPLGICFHFFTPQGSPILRSGFWSLSPIPDLDQNLKTAETYLASLPVNTRKYADAVHHYLKRTS